MAADAATNSVEVEDSWEIMLLFARVPLLYPDRDGGWPMNTREVVAVRNEDGFGRVPVIL